MKDASVNLVWQRRYRGLLPVARRSVLNSGQALLIRPDDFEPRTYQVLTITPGGDPLELGAISVEKVRRYECSPDGQLLVGLTNTDLYLFREGRKQRFLADRGALFADVALAPQPGWLLCGFSDTLYTHHSLGFGDSSGRCGWTRELPAPCNRVAITEDGRHMAAGLQSGLLLVLDNMRAGVYELATGSPLTALAMGGAGADCVAGTESGMLSRLAPDGGLVWQINLGLPIREVVTDGQAGRVAALISDGTVHSLVVLSAQGAPEWEYEPEAPPSGVGLSPDGRSLLLSLTNGTASLFQLEFADTPVSAPLPQSASLLDAAREAASNGSLERAREQYLALLADEPHAVEAAEELGALEQSLLEQYAKSAEYQYASGNLEAAVATLDRALLVTPWDPELVAARAGFQHEVVAEALTQGREAEALGDWDAAEAAWARALRLDSRALEARGGLARVRQGRARAFRALAETRSGTGDLAGAISYWQEAQRLDPRPETATRLQQAEAERSVKAGVALYEAQRLPEAEFQLKKAVALDPENETAIRYLGYIRGQTGTATVSDRFSRLE